MTRLRRAAAAAAATATLTATLTAAAPAPEAQAAYAFTVSRTCSMSVPVARGTARATVGTAKTTVYGYRQGTSVRITGVYVDPTAFTPATDMRLTGAVNGSTWGVTIPDTGPRTRVHGAVTVSRNGVVSTVTARVPAAADPACTVQFPMSALR